MTFLSFTNKIVSQAETGAIRKNIENIDLTPYVPVIVDEDFFIIDGQNRFLACKSLDKPIYYVVLPRTYETNEAMIALNACQQLWRQEEFLHFNKEQKGGCYTGLYEYMKFYNISISNAMVLYAHKPITSQHIKEGVMFEKSPMADDIGTFMNSSEVLSLRYRGKKAFAIAVRKMFETCTPRQILKLRKKIVIVPECANVDQYVTAFTNIIKKRT